MLNYTSFHAKALLLEKHIFANIGSRNEGGCITMERCAQLTNCLLKLEQEIQSLRTIILSEKCFPAWVEGGESETTAREQVIAIYDMLEFSDTQQGNTTVGLVGAIGANESVLKQARVVNEAKASFRKAWVSMADLVVELPAPDSSLSKTRTVSLREHHLRHNLGRGRLSVLQTWRAIPIADQVDASPHRIGFTLTRVPKVERITRAEALDRLLRLGDDDGIQAQIHQLLSVSESEPLAVVKPSPPHIRANVAWKVGTKTWVRKQYPATLPVLFRSAPGASLPIISTSKIGRLTEGVRERPRRLDAKVDAEPFLPAIHAHRYRKL